MWALLAMVPQPMIPIFIGDPPCIFLFSSQLQYSKFKPQEKDPKLRIHSQKIAVIIEKSYVL
jgi:hypothetical protein